VSEPTLLETLTIRGEAARRSIGSIALVTRMTPITLVWTTASMVAGLTVVGACSGPPVIPALLTRASSPPARSWTKRAAAVTLASSVTSSGTPNTSAPTARSFSTAASRAYVVPSADPDLVAQSTQAGGDLVTDALVRAGDERDLLISHWFAPTCRPVTCFPAGPIGPPAGEAVHLP